MVAGTHNVIVAFYVKNMKINNSQNIKQKTISTSELLLIFNMLKQNVQIENDFPRRVVKSRLFLETF